MFSRYAGRLTQEKVERLEQVGRKTLLDILGLKTRLSIGIRVAVVYFALRSTWTPGDCGLLEACPKEEGGAAAELGRFIQHRPTSCYDLFVSYISSKRH